MISVTRQAGVGLEMAADGVRTDTSSTDGSCGTCGSSPDADYEPPSLGSTRTISASEAGNIHKTIERTFTVIQDRIEATVKGEENWQILSAMTFYPGVEYEFRLVIDGGAEGELQPDSRQWYVDRWVRERESDPGDAPTFSEPQKKLCLVLGETGDTFTHAFEKAGDYNLRCRYRHDEQRFDMDVAVEVGEMQTQGVAGAGSGEKLYFSIPQDGWTPKEVRKLFYGINIWEHLQTEEGLVKVHLRYLRNKKPTQAGDTEWWYVDWDGRDESGNIRLSNHYGYQIGFRIPFMGSGADYAYTNMGKYNSIWFDDQRPCTGDYADDIGNTIFALVNSDGGLYLNESPDRHILAVRGTSLAKGEWYWEITEEKTSKEFPLLQGLKVYQPEGDDEDIFQRIPPEPETWSNPDQEPDVMPIYNRDANAKYSPGDFAMVRFNFKLAEGVEVHRDLRIFVQEFGITVTLPEPDDQGYPVYLPEELEQDPGAAVMLNEDWDNRKIYLADKDNARYGGDPSEDHYEYEPVLDKDYVLQPVENETDLVEITLMAPEQKRAPEVILSAPKGREKIRLWPRRAKGGPEDYVDIPKDGIMLQKLRDRIGDETTTDGQTKVYLEGRRLSQARLKLSCSGTAEAGTTVSDTVLFNVVSLRLGANMSFVEAEKCLYPGVDGMALADDPSSYDYWWDFDGQGGNPPVSDERITGVVYQDEEPVSEELHWVDMSYTWPNRRKVYDVAVELKKGDHSLLTMSRKLRVAFPRVAGRPLPGQEDEAKRQSEVDDGVAALMALNGWAAWPVDFEPPHQGRPPVFYEASPPHPGSIAQTVASLVDNRTEFTSVKLFPLAWSAEHGTLPFLMCVIEKEHFHCRQLRTLVEHEQGNVVYQDRKLIARGDLTRVYKDLRVRVGNDEFSITDSEFADVLDTEGYLLELKRVNYDESDKRVGWQFGRHLALKFAEQYSGVCMNVREKMKNVPSGARRYRRYLQEMYDALPILQIKQEIRPPGPPKELENTG
ncbi:MAG: hypothetical protein ACLFWL_13805 [Candidatus Brocadiia bacterium]